jgi:membrane-bound lytic murein transglycosylase A
MARVQSHPSLRLMLVAPASVVAALCVIGAACAESPDGPPGPLTLPDAQLEQIKWTDIDGWAKDDQLAAFNAFQVSCQLIRKTKQAKDTRPVYLALADICQRSANVKPANAKAARTFFEQNFRPVRITRLGEAQGFLTGYFEPIVRGSRFPSPEFHVPLYRRPPDLVAVGHKPGLDNFPNKGVQVGRFNESNELVPYFDRGEIEDGALDGRKLEICWLRDPFEALSISIQGSARVILEDGTPLRVNYDSHNGHPYSSIGRVLIERNLVPREEMSMQRIRDWMAANRDEAPKLRQTNRSYIFFRITGLSNDGEPVGGQGVPLTPGRSIAVDKPHVYGTPFFIEATLPIDSAKPVTPFRKLMIAQDTGSAIVGPARADLYWGAGDDAGRIAGRLRHPGKFVMLLPRELDLIAAGKQMPLPVAKPKIFEDQTGTEEAKKDEEATSAASAKAEETPKISEKTSEKAKPEVVRSEPVKTVAKPDVTKPDVTKPDITGTVATKSNAATKSDAIRTDAGKVNAAKIDAAKTDPTKTDAVTPDITKSKAKPDVVKTVAKPEVAKPEVAKPEVAKPEVAKSGVAKSETPKSDVTKSDITGTTATKTDAATKSDATRTDAGKVNAAKIDAAKTDPSKTEAVKPDTAKSNAVKPATAKSATAAKSEDHGKTAKKPRRQAAPTRPWWQLW